MIKPMFPEVRHSISLLQSPSDLEFCCWVGEAMPGEAVTYHRGFLAIDTSLELSRLDPPERARLVALAESARRAFEARLVHLLQYRLGPDRFAYMAVARPKPLSRRIALDTLLAGGRVS